MTRDQFIGLRDQVRILATSIGVRPAARAVGLDENRVLKWSERGKWGINGVATTLRGPPAGHQNVISPVEAAEQIVKHYGTRAKIGATIAGAKALEHLADTPGDALCKPANAISADQWTKAVDRAAGWTAARQQGVQVAVQVNMPSAEERAELRETDAKLDEIAALLRSTRPKA